MFHLLTVLSCCFRVMCISGLDIIDVGEPFFSFKVWRICSMCSPNLPAQQHSSMIVNVALTQYADEMDKRLLLAIQYECNSQSTNLPWSDIGRRMGEHITGGATIQHLAKLRTRMVEQGLPVPPPLKRGGGGGRISTAPSLPARARSSALKANPSSGRAVPMKKKRRAPTVSDESDEDASDSDADSEYGKPITKRAKTGKKKHPSSKVKAEKDSFEDEELDSDNATVKGENADDERVVAAGASFLSLEKNVPGCKQVSKEAEAKPSLIVRLPMSSRGRVPFKTESSGEDDDSTESSEDYSEDEGEDVEADEDNAVQTLAAMSSKGKESAKVFADPSSTRAPYDTLSTMHRVMADSHSFNQLHPYDNSSVQTNFGGLPFSYSSFGNNNFPSHHDSYEYFNSSGGYAGPNSAGSAMFDSRGNNNFHNGFDSYGNVSGLGAHGTMNPQLLHNDYASFDSSHGMHFSNNAMSQNSDLRFGTATCQPSDLVRGHPREGDTAISSFDPTPTSDNGACAMGGLPYDGDLIEDAG